MKLTIDKRRSIREKYNKMVLALVAPYVRQDPSRAIDVRLRSGDAFILTLAAIDQAGFTVNKARRKTK